MARASSRGRYLADLFSRSPQPIYVVDEQRRIVYCNPACLEWLAMPEEQVLEVRCDYHATGGGGAAGVAAALCPPPEAFRGERCSAWVSFRSESGAVWCRHAEFLPVGSVCSDEQAVIAALGPLGEPPSADRPIRSVDHTAKQLHERLLVLSAEVHGRYRLERLAGDSPAMRRVREQVRLAITGLSRVLIIGPAGSGREHVARTIHGGANPEAAGPLLPLSGDLLEAELLDTTLRAFLRRCAVTPSPPPASLLLLEVDQLGKDAQAQLLTFLRDPSFQLRTLVTACQSLTALAAADQFSRELAFLLSTLVIELPPLAERRADISLLAQQLVEEHNARGGAQLSGFTPEALDQLGVMPWPGNMGELAEVVEQACHVAAGPWIRLEDLPQRVRMLRSAAAHPTRPDERIVLDDYLARIEKELIERALRRTRGNKAKAARLLGVQRARLLRRLGQLGLNPER